ncbi:ABC transporter permease [Bacillus sp. FJAT-42376]|uniref:ABC transporter permease n=1 Tax=Bacillus sp. FJAT-42376 TaxID=2014076 RepID=UPI000F4F2730|nr:ABC transporter permease [Bacillus sp. FJAT-42376]AZB41010.1 ABC transporter permease [Bacillus sp. FJAT-42376]
MRIVFFTVKQMLKKPFLFLSLLVLPAAVIYGVSNFSGKVEEDLAIPVAIVDQDHTDFSKTLIQRLKKQERLKLVQTTGGKAQNMLLREETDTVFVIKEGFKESIEAGDREGIIELRTSPLSIASGVVREVAASEVIRFTSNAKAANRVEKIAEKYQENFPQQDGIREEAYRYADRQWEPEPLMTINYVTQEDGRDVREKSSGPGLFESPVKIWMVLALILCMLSWDWIPKERDSLFKRIQTTPAGLDAYILHSFAAYGALHLIQIGLSWWVIMRLDNGTSASLLLPMAVFMLLGLSISLLAASFSPYTGNYYTLSTVWIFAVSLIGGSVLPAGELLPQLKTLEDWLPQNPVLNWKLADALVWVKLVLMFALSTALVFISMSRLRSTR